MAQSDKHVIVREIVLFVGKLITLLKIADHVLALNVMRKVTTPKFAKAYLLEGEFLIICQVT